MPNSNQSPLSKRGTPPNLKETQDGLSEQHSGGTQSGGTSGKSAADHTTGKHGNAEDPTSGDSAKKGGTVERFASNRGGNS